jgi:hypothetical protein
MLFFGGFAMGREQSRSSNRDLTPRERKARLRSFNPTGAAFVLHLAECERCRRHAAKLLGPGEDTASGVPGFSTDERDIILHLTRGGYLLSLSDDAPQDDLPLVELQKFLRSLSPEQTAFIGHLLGCERCRGAVAKTLKPPAVSAARKVLPVLG